MSSNLILVENIRAFYLLHFFNKSLGGEFHVIEMPTGSPSFIGFAVKSIEKFSHDDVDSIVLIENLALPREIMVFF